MGREWEKNKRMFFLTLTRHIKELTWCAFYCVDLSEFFIEPLNVLFI